MKKLLLPLYITGLINLSFAQNETNLWYFGYNAAIDFTSGAPVSLNTSNVSTDEGSASISDSAGNLLFYTDGITVWNANHVVMTNGSNLMGGISSTQSALIIPRPGSNTLYYIFTVSEQLNPGGLRYSVVDMSLQGGLGKVILKNILLDDPSTEKITAVCHSNMMDIWVIAHDWNNNNFQAYLLSDTGLNISPVVSSSGAVHNGLNGNTIGYMKSSPDGSRLALAVYKDNFFEVFDFDKSTGIVSHDIHLPSFPQASSGAYGVEFSPYGSKLYGTVNTPGYIYQWDLNAGSDSSIVASKTLVGTSALDLNGALQLASDGKIYMAAYFSAWLGVINDPDTAGIGCNFVDQGFQLTSGFNGFGLPNIYPCFFSSSTPTPEVSIATSDTSVCEKFCVDFTDSSTNNPTAWEWIFEGANPSTSTVQNPTDICYETPGNFDVTLITTNANGSDTLTLLNYITVYTTPFPTITQNGNTLTSSPADSYQWQLNSVDISGATTQTYEATQSGLYTVIITDSNGCTNSATIDVVFTGIENLFSDSAISIYPNPSNGILKIELLSDYEGDEISIEIFNMIGQLIFYSEEKFLSKKMGVEINLLHQPEGVYLFKISSNSISFNRKIIIIH